MNEIKKKKKLSAGKIIAIIVAVLLVIVAVALAFVGNYFVNFALMRPEPGKSATSQQLDEANAESEEYQAMIDMYGGYAEYIEAGNEWYEDTDFDVVSIQSEDDLKLVAREHVQGDGNRWVILVHGYTSQHTEMSGFAGKYTEQGYSVLMPDMRSHGESEGEVIGMGWLDRKDMVLWIDYILESHPDAEIVLHGQSMGGATVLMTSGEELPSNVRAIVSDCAYSGVWQEFTSVLKSWFNLPQFPVLDASNLVFKLRGGYSLRDASALDQVAKSVTPILFIHGSADDFVPTDMVNDLYAAAECDKELLIVEGAGHGCSQYEDNETYYETLFDFLGNYVG